MGIINESEMSETLADLREELREWQTLRLWGGTPKHIDENKL
jgi:hypothetical protein